MEEDHEAGASENGDAGVAVSRVCDLCGVWCECTHQALESRERSDAAGQLHTPYPADKCDVLHVRDARETCSARTRRISDADALRRRYTKPLRPLYERIGHRDARRDRQKWRERLDEKVEMERRERDVESVFRIVCGNIDDRFKLVVLRDEQLIVAFF